MNSFTSKSSAGDVLHLPFRTKATNVPVIQQVSSELIVLATEIRVSIRYQEP